jgi:hypothetical protein
LAYLAPSSSTSTSARKWIPFTLNPNARLGETAVVISGKSGAWIDNGIVTLLSDTSDSLIDTNIPASAIVAGSPIIAVDGTLLGISTSVSRVAADGGFIAASVLSHKDDAKLPNSTL